MIDFSLKLNLKDLRKAGAGVQFAMGGFMQREGDALLAESREEVPVETGATWLSGYAQPLGRFTNTISVEVGYTTEYAIYVHEILRYRHPTGKAKFLEDPFNRRAPGLQDRAGQELLAFLGRRR